MNAGDDGAAAREQAARVLAHVWRGHALDAALPAADAALSDPRDRGLLRAICFATLRAPWRYEALLDALLARDGAKLDRLVRAALLAGLAQLDAGIAPPYAAVSGTVAAVRALGRPRLAALANAVLRRFLREREALLAALPDDPVQRHQHSRWLVDALARDWPADVARILAANNAPAPMLLRASRRRGGRDAALAALAAAGLAATAHPHLPDAIVLAEPVDVHALPGFDAGALSVQDGAAQLAADLMDLRPGLRVLDACAAPGGKAAHLLEREPAIDLLALDESAPRAARIEAGFARLGLAGVVRVADATAPAGWWDGRPFDRILVDAPCSGSGVIRRHPDIRRLRRAGDVAALCATQDRLLNALWPLLAPGGRLVYATCSVLADENARRIAAFLARTPDARPRDAVPAWFGVASGAGRQHFPGDDGLDGFYYAVLARD
ncbi:MAG: 16S rRNA (cytosine(967)-C(5))-methyltransferase RsmB [Xanthomonadaceae bacterium]|nr:16S rRNA (cytosine(967)-C(5))-methyltransferase RsmB [Xanthomonadaceae bacterium]